MCVRAIGIKGGIRYPQKGDVYCRRRQLHELGDSHVRHVRVKSGLNPEHLQDRLQYHPEILELHLNEQDVLDPAPLVQVIRSLKASIPKVYLHHPPKFRGQFLDIISSDPSIRTFYDESTRVLIEIARAEDVRVVIHAHYMGTDSKNFHDAHKVKELSHRIAHFEERGSDVLLWENTIEGIFSTQNPDWITSIVEPLDLRLCMDISHAFIALHGDNEGLIRVLERVQPYADYFHVVDSMGTVHDGLALGEGKIDWRRVKDFLMGKDFIYEIDLRSSGHKDCTPMLESAEYLLSL